MLNFSWLFCYKFNLHHNLFLLCVLNLDDWFAVLSNKFIKPLLCKNLFSVVLFCSIIMGNAIIIYYVLFWNNTFYWMIQSMVIASFTCDNFNWINTWIFPSVNKNYNLSNPAAKVEKVLTIFSRSFFNLE